MVILALFCTFTVQITILPLLFLSSVVIPRIDITLTANGTELLRQLDVLQYSDDMGYDISIKVLDIVQNNVV